MSPYMSPNPLWSRDLGSELKAAPETLSSWDNCMAKSYCKWPVVAAIIVGSVIVIAILACVINCLCCGIQCCRCCGCCSCCCPKPRNKKPKYMDDPYDPSFNQPPPPMPAPSGNVYAPSPAPPVYRGTAVARFDSPASSAPPSKANEDALPAMPTWDSAVSRRVENDHDAVEMEPLNLANQEPRRTPSASQRPLAPGYMGPPPMRTGTPGTQSSFYPESRAYDEQSLYRARSPGPRSPAPMGAGPMATGPISPYDQSHHDYPGGHPFQTMSPAPPTMSPAPPSMSPAPMGYAQPQYMALGPSASPAPDGPRPIPYRQPSPGLNALGGPVPYRQPSPGFNPAPLGSPAPNVHEQYQAMPMPLPYRQPSPGIGMAIGHRTDSPRPIPFRQPSPAINQMPYAREMSPSIPSSPPPPFSAVPGPNETTSQNNPGRPPSLLQSGRKPAPNSYKDL